MAIFSPNVENIEAGNVAISNFPATQPVSGSVAVSNFPATQPVSGTVTVANPGLTDSQLRATAVPVSGPLTDAQLRATPVPVSGNFSSPTASTATVTNVAVSASVATLSVANPSRIKAIIHNESGTLFVKYGTGASATSYTYRLIANTTLESTQYTGVITAIKASGASSALVTEL